MLLADVFVDFFCFLLIFCKPKKRPGALPGMLCHLPCAGDGKTKNARRKALQPNADACRPLPFPPLVAPRCALVPAALTLCPLAQAPPRQLVRRPRRPAPVRARRRAPRPPPARPRPRLVCACACVCGVARCQPVFFGLFCNNFF